MIDPNVVGGITSIILVVTGLIAGPQRTIKAVNWIGWAISATWFKWSGQAIPDKPGYPPHDKLIPDHLPPELEPIDYKALEKANYQSMRDSWDERFLKLHKLEDLDDKQLEQLSKYEDIDRDAVLIEANKRLHAKNVARRKQRDKKLSLTGFKQSDIEKIRSLMNAATQEAMLSNECARGKHRYCPDPMCDCDCHVKQ